MPVRHGRLPVAEGKKWQVFSALGKQVQEISLFPCQQLGVPEDTEASMELYRMSVDGGWGGHVTS